MTHRKTPCAGERSGASGGEIERAAELSTTSPIATTHRPAPAETIIIVATPATNHIGKRLPGLYDGSIDGRPVIRSREPFLDGARVLLAQGSDPTAHIVMRHIGSDTDCLISTIGRAAKWTVTERDRDGLRFERWKPSVVPHTAALVDQSGKGRPDMGACAARISGHVLRPRRNGSAYRWTAP